MAGQLGRVAAGAQHMRGHLAMLMISALVAGSFSLGSLAASQIAPSAIIAARFVLASVLVGAAAVATVGIPKSTWRAPWRYLVLGGVGLTVVALAMLLKEDGGEQA